MHTFSQPQWFAVYTRPQAEKKIAREFENSEIDYFLPLYKTLRVWSDRKKKVEVPLIRSYIFVKAIERQFYYIIQTPGVVNIVKFSGRPVPVPEWQLENLRILMTGNIPVQCESLNYKKGEQVVITFGPLKGLRGSIRQIKGRHKLIISVDALKYSLLIDLDPCMIQRSAQSA